MRQSGEALAAGVAVADEEARRPAPEQRAAAYLDLWERALREALLHGPGASTKTPE